MLANECSLGQRFKNIQLDRIFEVIQYEDGEYYFEDTTNGDLYDFIEEDLYKEIY